MGEWNPNYKLKDVVSAEGHVPDDPKYYMEKVINVFKKFYG